MFNPGNLVKRISYTGMLCQLLSFIFASQSKRSSTAFQKMCWEHMGRWLPAPGAPSLPARRARVLLGPPGSHLWSSHYSTCCLSQATPCFEWLGEAFSKLLRTFLLQCSTEFSSVYPTEGVPGLKDFKASQQATWQQAPWSITSDFGLQRGSVPLCLSCVVATESQLNKAESSSQLFATPSITLWNKIKFLSNHTFTGLSRFTLELSPVSLPLTSEPFPKLQVAPLSYGVHPPLYLPPQSYKF